MCTVTYLPLDSQGYLVTSTRDEKLVRKPARHPGIYELSGQKMAYPRDEEALGTWIVSTQSGTTLCLLNGGFRIHEPKPPYRRSRGLVVLDLLSTGEDFMVEINRYNFERIEPFTLVYVNQSKKELREFRWDEEQLHQSKMAFNEPHIWASVTLYTEQVISQRTEWFRQWLSGRQTYNIPDIIRFHKRRSTGDIRNDKETSRENAVRTVSIASVRVTPGSRLMYYEDTIDNTYSEVLF